MEDEAPPGVPEWVVTYGDMMSLLLTFFIMLVSMSQLKEEGRVRAALDSLTEVFGATDSDASGVPGRSILTTSSVPYRFSDGVRSEGSTKKTARDADGVSGAFDPVDQLREGKRVTLGGPGAFARFSADPTEELRETLERLVGVLNSSRKQVAVRGHTSPEPLPDGHEMQDHRQLAFERAALVAEYLISQGVAADRIVLASASSSEPRIKTRDPDRQRMNDRVDVYLIDSYTSVP